MKIVPISAKPERGVFFHRHPSAPSGPGMRPAPEKDQQDTLAKIRSLSRIAAALQSLNAEAREKDPKRLFRVVSKN